MAVDYTPEMKEYSNQGKFRYWVQMVLPTIYDDSLSYMELLNKVVYAINLAVEDVDNVEDNVTALLTAFQNLQQYTNDYFDNLDVQEEIEAKLDKMAADGTLNTILDPVIADSVTAWMNEHITPTTPVVDASLTVSGAAADAKVTGDNIRFLTSNVIKYNAYNAIGMRETDNTASGITYTSNGDGSYNVTGTATARSNYNILNSANSMPDGFIPGEKIKVYYNGFSKVQFQMFKYVNGNLSSSSFVSIIDDKSVDGVEVDIPSDATGILARLSTPNGTTIEGVVTVTPIVLNTLTNKDIADTISVMKLTTDLVEENKKYNSYNQMPIRETPLTHNGITYTPNNGSYSVSGLGSSSRSWCNLYDNSNGFPDGIAPGKTTTFYYNGSGVVQLQIYKYINGELISAPVVLNIKDDYSAGYECFIPEDATGILIRLSVQANTQISDPITVRPEYLNAKSNSELESLIKNLAQYSLPVKYAAFGDSLTYSAVWDENQSTSQYQADFINQIPTRIANAIGSNDFINYGVGGSRFVARESGEVTIGDTIKSVDLMDYEIITIGGGRNDSNTPLGDGDTATANDGTICGALADIFEYLNANYPELQVVMYGVTPQPTTEAHAPSDIYTRVFGGGWSLNTYYTEMAKLCKRYGVAFIDWYDCTLILQWGQLSGGYSRGNRNWSHPKNQHIYKQLGNYLGGKVAGIYKG